MDVKVNMTRQNGVGSQLRSIREFLNNMKLIDHSEKYTIDFSDFRYCPPLLSVFFACYLENNPSLNIENLQNSGYFNAIRFPFGIEPKDIDNWSEYLDSFKSKSYLPLIHFSTLKDGITEIERNNLLSHLNDLIRKISGLPVNYYSAISYLISELTDNIVDHSKSSKGWLSFQYYRRERFLDLAIADTGIGLLNSYKEYKGEKDFSSINTHIEALDNVIKGNSTKSEERGYGVHTSREMIIDGLGGTFVMISGDAIIVNYNLFDFKCIFEGTLIFLRIPCGSYNNSFSINKYIES